MAVYDDNYQAQRIIRARSIMAWVTPATVAIDRCKRGTHQLHHCMSSDLLAVNFIEA